MEVSFRRSISIEQADALKNELVELFSTQGDKMSVTPDVSETVLFDRTLSRVSQYRYPKEADGGYTFILMLAEWDDVLSNKKETVVNLLFKPNDNTMMNNILSFSTSSFNGTTVPILHYYKGERIELLPLPRKKGHAYPLGDVWWTLCNIESWDLLMYKSEKLVYWVAYSPMLSGLVKNNQNNSRAVVYGPERRANIFINTIKQIVPLCKNYPSGFGDVAQVLLKSGHFPLYRLIECFDSLTNRDAVNQNIEQWPDPIVREKYIAELVKSIQGVRDLILEYCWVHWGDIEVYIMLICTYGQPLEITPDYLCKWTSDT